MRRISAGLNATSAAFDTHRLGPGGGMLLLTLDDLAPARMQDLVQALARDKSQMTRGVQMLEAKGLVTRSPCPEDARASILDLTEEGRRTVVVLQQAVADVLGEVLSPLSEEERDALGALLSRI